MEAYRFVSENLAHEIRSGLKLAADILKLSIAPAVAEHLHCAGAQKLCPPPADKQAVGTFAITFTKRLPSEKWEVLEHEVYTMSWGNATVYIQKKTVA